MLPLLAAVFLNGACGNDPTAPTPNLPNPALEVFTGPMDPGGLNTYLFTLQTPSTVQLMLAGVVIGEPLRSISPALRVQLAQWNGTECAPLESIDVEPRMTAALHRRIDPGTYCAVVSDPNHVLTEPVGIVMRAVAPVLISTGGSPGSATFTSTITPGGMSTRTFEASHAGDVNITLTNLSPAVGTAALGIGLLATDGSGCKATRIVRTAPGASPQITARVDAGDYCVLVFDDGAFVDGQSFSVKIDHP